MVFVWSTLQASAAQVPQSIDPPLLTPQPPIVSQEIPVSVNNSVEVEQNKEDPESNKINSSLPPQIQCSTDTQTPVLTTTEQQMPYSNPSASVPYFSSATTTTQNSPVPAFQVINSQYNPQLSTFETVKPFGIIPQVTPLQSFTTQGLTTFQEPSSQLSSTQELSDQSTSIITQSGSQCYPTDVKCTTSDVSSSKEISNYFTQYQNQANPLNSSTIPMFSVKNFPQMSPLAQPLGK